MHDRFPIADRLITAARELSRRVELLDFRSPVTHIYNPLGYAAKPHEAYIRRFADTPKRVLFWGMNPGPWGMAQTGVPFGEISAVRRWMGICEPVAQPPRIHPKRPIEGFACSRSEVSGRRFWGLMRSRFETAERFFEDHFVANYCPLVFMESTGKNRTPDKLGADERRRLFEACDEHARRVVELLDPAWVIGIGKFAEKRLTEAIVAPARRGMAAIRVGGILHPSPANPRANREWEAVAAAELSELGVW